MSQTHVPPPQHYPSRTILVRFEQVEVAVVIR